MQVQILHVSRGPSYMYISTNYTLCRVCLHSTAKFILIPPLTYTRTCYERCAPHGFSAPHKREVLKAKEVYSCLIHGLIERNQRDE